MKSDVSRGSRTMLIFSRAPLFLWDEAIATACFTQNRLIIHRRFNKTPYELINGRKPNISFLQVFSVLCYPKNDREDIGKLGAKEAARTILIFSRAPLFLWAEAIATACFTQNRSIIHHYFNKTPYELINGRKLDISFLHVFGALCYPKNDREDIGKLGAKGDIGFFVGGQNELQCNIYKNAKLRTQLFKKASDQKENSEDSSKNTKFAKQPNVEILSKIDNTKTRRPQPRSNTKNDRVPSASKSSRSMNKGVKVEEHHRNLLLSKKNKHISSACNNSKIDSKDVISKVVCVVTHKANVSTNETQQKNQPEVKKPNKVGFIKSLATPKPRKPRFLLRWSPTGKMFDQDGKLVAPSNSESHVDCSNGDNACTSNAMEPKIKRFPKSTSLLGRLSKFVCGASIQVVPST
nr:retrovirus-related Pol polyprotein from transposon TNT 1-94 [Tanacetum cinerariifolium]